MKKLLLYGLVFILLAVTVFSQTYNASLYFSFDDADNSGGLPQDLSPFGNNADTNTANTGATGLLLQAYDFVAASSDYVNVPDAVSLEPPTNYVLRAWIKPDVGGVNQGIICKDGNQAGESRPYCLIVASDNSLRFFVNGGGSVGTNEVRSSSNVINISSWQQVVAVHRGTNLEIYVNGTSVGTASSSVPASTYGTEDLQIGARSYSTSRIFFDGTIDEATLINTSWSDADVLADFNSGVPVNPNATPTVSADAFYIVAKEAYDNADIAEFKTNITFNATTITARTTNSSIVFNETYDFSGNNNTLTNSNTVYNTSKFFFNGVDSYLTGSVNNSNEMTFIVNFTATNADIGNPRIIATTSTHYLLIQNFQNFGVFATCLDSYIIQNNTPVWYAVTHNFSSGDMKIYREGVSVKNCTGVSKAFSSTLIVGHNENLATSGHDTFEGNIETLQIYNRILTADEIANQHANGESINSFEDLGSLYPFQRITNSTTANITTFKDNYLVSDTQTNYLTNTTLTAYLSQSQISLSATELITNASVNGNFTIGATTYGTNETINITAGDYNVTFSASGYFNKTQQITVTGGTSEAFIISDVGNSQVNVTFYQVVGNLSATNVSGYIYNSTYGYNETFDTGSTNYYAFNVVQDINITVVVNNALYSASEFSIYVNETYTNMTQYLYTFNSVLMTFYDQDTLLNLSGVNITVELISDLQSTLNYTNTSQLYLDLLAPETYTVRYSADGYAQSFYEFTLTNQSDTQLSLYLINESNVTDVTFIVLDEISTKLEDAIIKIHKYNPTTGNYILVEILTTNFEGEAVGSIKLGSEFYYFIVEYPSGTIVKTTTPSYIYDTTVQLPVVLTDPIATQFFQVNGISTSLVFNNATNNFKYTYSDGANLLEYGCLIVYRVTSLTRTVYNSSCNAGASGQVLLNVDNITGATYLAQGYVIFTDEAEAITNSLWKGFTDDQVFGELGLIGGLIIIITLVLLGVWNPAVSIVLGTLGLALIKIAGLITIGWGYVAGIIALGLILVFVISRRS